MIDVAPRSTTSRESGNR